MKKILFALAGLTGSLFISASAQAGRLDVSGTTDVYGQVSAQNFGVGAGIEHWFNNNVGIGGGVSGGIGSNFEVIDVRALFLLDNEFDIANSPARPFASAGLAAVQGPSYFGSNATGAGPEISAGVMWETPWVKNLYFRPEIIVHLFNVKTTYAIGGTSYTYDAGYQNVDATFAAVYRF